MKIWILDQLNLDFELLNQKIQKIHEFFEKKLKNEKRPKLNDAGCIQTSG